jgi:hypothetical protein
VCGKCHYGRENRHRPTFDMSGVQRRSLLDVRSMEGLDFIEDEALVPLEVPILPITLKYLGMNLELKASRIVL